MQTTIWTYQDIVEHLLDVFDNSRSGRPLRMAKRAAREALRELSSCHRWACYEASRQFRSTAQQTTGTIEYDHTGGTYERYVTFSDTTVDSSSRYSRIIIDSVHYPIERYIDSTHITLDASFNPGADVAAGTSYTLYRSAYPLPVDLAEFGVLMDLTNDRRIPVKSADQEMLVRNFVWDTPDTPWQALIQNVGEFINSLSLVFTPAPSSAILYELTYNRMPRPLRTEKYNTGTVTTAADSDQVTITTGAFTTDHVGCILCIGTESAEPTNVFGDLDDQTTLPTVERTILAVSTDGTTCVVDSNIDTEYTDYKFTISDPIDMEYNSMLTAYQRVCEWVFSKLTKRERSVVNDRKQDAYEAISLAKERDNRAITADTVIYYDPFSRTNVTDAD